MSRLGKKPIVIPEGVEVNIENSLVETKGPKGELKRQFKPLIEIERKENTIELKPKVEEGESLALWGTYASHINNMIVGVSEGFKKSLLVEGVGFKVQLNGKTLVMHLGFSHPVEMEMPEGIDIEVEKNKINISGADKELVGETAAKIRAKKKPEPYKGKGIRYENEVVRRKAGKKAVGTA